MNAIDPRRSFGLDNRMTVVLFAGMGGGCDGLEAAGYHVHLAINHDPLAIAVHEKRHPHTRHLRCDVFEVDPREATRGRGVRILHASPDCTHFSVAKGSKPVSKRRRSLAWVVVRWAGQVRPEVITLENVQEIQTWGPLIAKRDKVTGRVLKLDGSVAAKGEVVRVQDQQLVPDPRRKGVIWRAWLKHLADLGYSFEGKVLVCADYGIPTIRKRFFGVAKADGSPVQWPERTHAPRKLAKKLKLQQGRAVELNPAYFLDGCQYVKAMADELAMPDLFGLMGIEHEEKVA
jgi:DNA (cytosine-5)-methyltransferase 1